VKVPVSWLRDYVTFEQSVEELADRLNMTGTALEGLHTIGVPVGSLDSYKVARVITRDQHPNADRLSLCTVDVGEGEPRQIVCGARNFEAGATVAVVLPGGTLPDGTVLKKAKLRGEESDGMMLSERELGLSDEHEGIMVLDSSLPVGAPLADYLPIGEQVLDLEITSNRPDCLCVYGVAREVSAVYDIDLAAWPGDEPEATGEGTVADYVTARVDDPDLCPRWAGRVFTDVKVGPSPAWLKARLVAAGMRSISNVVDITNYVMLAVGEPTHAFDLDRVAGREIIVRRATEGEPVVTLDGQRRVLDSEVLVIADAEKPSAIGGLMGSEGSEVHDGTTTVLIECANFDALSCYRSSARLGLRTEGSTRWEKGLDIHLPPRALALVSQLMVDLCGARLVPGTIDIHGDLPEPPVAPLRPERLKRMIGIDYEPAEVTRILTRLGYAAEDGGWRVPTWRAGDAVREIDLVEEVARVAGFERIPAILPGHEDVSGRLDRQERLCRRVVQALLGAGVSEAVTVTFSDPALHDTLRLPPGDPRRDAIVIRNPLGADQAHMRTLVFPRLLDSAARNLAHGRQGVGLFEIGNTYRPSDGEVPDQPLHLAAVLVGEGAGFLELKGRLETVCRALGVELAVEAAAEPFLHPGRAARIEPEGFIGELHPEVARDLGLDVPVAVLELPLRPLFDRVVDVPTYRDVVSFPPVRQDIAVVVERDVPAGDLVAEARTAGGELLTGVQVFDVYEGEQLGEDRKSVALHLVFQATDRTLTNAEADAARDTIVAALAERFGAQLRG
jgi:phenylalanyl-tRNA synthetase beta chain